MRRVVRAAIAAFARTGMGRQLVRAGGKAPVAMKTPVYLRLLGALARHSDLTELVTTNLGLSDTLRLRIPVTKIPYVYGRPDEDLGERATLDLVVTLCGHSDGFIDGGAHEGLFSFAVAPTGTSLHLFEPDPVLFARLTENLAANDVQGQLNQAALGAVSGEASFFRNLESDASGSLSEMFTGVHATEETLTKVWSLADYLKQHDLRRACVKIDVEGAAEAAWTGAGGALDRIEWLVCEMIAPEIDANLPGRIIQGGLNAYYIRDYDLMISKAGEWDAKDPCYNWLFTRQGPEELKTLLAGTRFSVLPSTSNASPPKRAAT